MRRVESEPGCDIWCEMESRLEAEQECRDGGRARVSIEGGYSTSRNR